MAAVVVPVQPVTPETLVLLEPAARVVHLVQLVQVRLLEAPAALPRRHG